VKCDIPVIRICQENPNFVKIIKIRRQLTSQSEVDFGMALVYRTLEVKTQVSFNVAGEIRTPQKPSVRMKSYQAVTTAEEV
jgi:hypothetical protein